MLKALSSGMLDLEADLGFDFEFRRGGSGESRAWFAALPIGLKIVYLAVTVPAWLFGMFCIVTDQGKSTAAFAAFAVFAATAIPFLVHQRRSG